MNIIGFCYATGVSYCDKGKEEYPLRYKEIAYVWENGTIDWKIDESKYDLDTLLPIYKCSASHINKVNEMKNKLKELEEEYPTLEKNTLKHHNVGRYIDRLKLELEDLEKYKTTCVIHYY